METTNKSDILKEKVVELVRLFVRSEGGITQADLQALFGHRHQQEVASCLAEMPITFK